MIFDTHAHYDDEQFDTDRELLLESMEANGIGRIVNIGANVASTKAAVDLAQQYSFMYAAVGVHPSEAHELNEEVFGWLETMTHQDKVVAVGEIGLDYYWDKEQEVRDNQKKWFIRQMELARKVNLPISIHSRDAAKDTLDLVKAYGKGLGGVVHCFSYGVEMAREYLNMDYYIGVGGVVTFNNAKNIKEVVAYAPMDRIVIETDCPYLSPVPYRGKRNSSLYLPHVVEKIAEIKGITPEEVREITWKNGVEMYRMKNK